MTTTLWIIDITLIALVLLQVRRRRLTMVQILLPIALVLWAGIAFVHSVPLGGHNASVIGVLILAGALLGTAIGFTTQMSTTDGRVTTRAGVVAAALWIAGMGARLVFQLWATGDGRLDLGRFDFEHAINNDVWPAALVLMAGATVLLRVSVILARARRLRADRQPSVVTDDVRA
ncbi:MULTISPECIES: hypothetical protein [unclassified Curtobacterium]|uniref:hypothetical protein n=1 Tax=unclassified Curtobacterium TaxID=257496 RepID=UPI000DA993C9|nr:MULTISPECIES: hypothetical protein [unclassified Curtobacterium]PZE37142.1 hypothetical protein DEJ31_08475 [Curtobacterium sp. MCPF17_031]PZF15522.1 hypothetical protein DEJ25_01995 [Curtobacterium sp. MCPF17_011]